jgi:hypothetical protein
MHLIKKWFHEKRRATYSLKVYSKYFGSSVVDIGSGASSIVFREALGSRFQSVDFNSVRAEQDYYVDLENSRLPFRDGEFETVLCFDNLEHLENCYEMFDELIRISSKYIIVSLPNNWPTIIKSVLHGRNITHRTGYGLPPEKPAPGVRHKWFFNLEEAENFIRAAASRNRCQIRELDFVYERTGFNLISVPILYPKLFSVSDTILERLFNLDMEDQNKFGKKAILAQQVLKILGLKTAKVLLKLIKVLSWPFYVIDEFLKHLIWGWGSRYRYLNLFCRQVWVVIEKPS